MKTTVRNIFSPILNFFESGKEEYNYKKSHRTILIIVGFLFFVLSLISTITAVETSQFGAVVPCVIFFLAGFVCVIVGSCGNDRAVSKMWGNK